MSMKSKSKQILMISELAFRNITILLLCVLIGIKLDEYFNTKPIFILVFSVLSLIYLIVSMLLMGKNKNEL